MLEGALFGIAGVLLLGLLCWGIVTIVSLIREVRKATAGLISAVELLAKTATMADTGVQQVGALRRMIQALEQMNATVKVFNDLVLAGNRQNEVQPDGSYTPPPQSVAGRTPPPPPPWRQSAAYNEFAGEDEASLIEQTDEDLARVAEEAEAREQGIELDVLKAVMPDARQVNYSES